MRKALRLRRLSRPHDDRYLFVPLDHSVSDGPVVPRDRWHDLIRAVVLGGADAIIVHKGRVRTVDPAVLGGCALIVHLSAGTAHMADTHAKVLVGEVDEALRLGADAVSVHVNIGSDTESRQLADLGTVAAECERWNMPLVVMAYARGPRIGDAAGSAVLAHVVNIAADLGADIVKTNLARPAEEMAEVTASCPVPVIVAGGPASEASLAAHARTAMATGCAGLAVGRRVFTSPTPMQLVAELASIVHAPVGASLVHALTSSLENR